MATSPSLIDNVHPRLATMTSSRVLLQRIRAEFLEMPGLTLTLPQAARLWGATALQAEMVLGELVEDGFLARGPHGSYRRRGFVHGS